MLSMRVWEYAGRQGMQVEYVAAYIQVQVMEVCRFMQGCIHCMREPTSKVGMHQQRLWGGGGESDGSCHNIPSTNSLISTSRFQIENQEDEEGSVDDKDDDGVYLQL